MNRRNLLACFTPSHIIAGFIAVLVGYTSSAAIVFQAAHAAGANAAQIGSWLWALGLGMGVTCIGLSLYLRTPILTAWSTPGAALLATALLGHSMQQAVAAFLFSSLLITVLGVSGWFERCMRYVPTALASAMLAGVLLRFALAAFTHLPQQPWLVGSMLLIFLLARRIWPRYAVALTFAWGLGLAWMQGGIKFAALSAEWVRPVWTSPSFDVATLIGVGIPLFIVTMASQNVPGLAVLRANGYQTPASPLITSTGLVGLILAPFGGFAFNLAAITAAICMSPDADPDPHQRYRAAVWAGVFYLATGIFGAGVASLFIALPPALIAAVAGLALLATIGNSLVGALQGEEQRDAALLTFVVTASGMSLGGIGSAFWGLVAGLLALALQRWVGRKS